MRRPEFIAKQSRCPERLLGTVVARVMAHETAGDNLAALDFLEVQPSDTVLEIGFGHGRTIAAAAARAYDGQVAGVEISERMLRMASRFNKKYIESQRVDLRLSNGWSLPYGDSSFDKVYSVHTLYFWDKPSEYIQEIARVLRPRGRFVLGFRPGDDPTTGNFPASIYRFYTVDELGDLLAAGGFTKINMERGRTATGTMVFTICEAPQQTKAIAAADRGLPCAQTH